MNRSTTWFSILPTLVIPVCLGLVCYIALMAAIEHQWITDPTVLRYLIGHPVSKISVGMFFVGGISLLLIGLDVFQQLRCVGRIGLGVDGPVPSEASIESEPASATDSVVEKEVSTVQHAASLGKELMDCNSAWHEHYLFKRLASVLESIFRTGSAAHVEEELKYLSDGDIEQQQQRYSFVQILIWATPMLGFLGTVLGISQALGGITVGPDNNFQTMMDGLKASLYVAFDTTALALTLSMILMFGQFFIERFESQLLRIVTQRAHYEVSSQFDLVESLSAGSDFEARLIATMESASERQTQLWRESMRWVGTTLSESIIQSQARLESTLEASIDHTIQGLAETVGESIERADHAMAHRWEQWQVILSENARGVSNSQIVFSEQTQAICRMLEQTTRQTCQSTQDITNQIRAKALEINQKLESVGDVLKSGRLTPRAGENMASANSRFAVAEGNWISVAPEFLGGTDDGQQVLLTFPSSDKRSEERSHGNSRIEIQSYSAKREPEVVLPFLKKSA